jgi:hypothetical protein
VSCAILGKKDFYLNTPGSFDLVFTLLESTTLSKLSYIKNKTKRNWEEKNTQNLQTYQIMMKIKYN